MPCEDISEIGVASFNQDEELVSYQLQKISCGASINGQRLIDQFFHGKTIQHLANLSVDDTLSLLSKRNLITNFDERKTAFSLRALCQTYLGKELDQEVQSPLEILEININQHGSTELIHTLNFEKNLPVQACSTKCSSKKTKSCNV